MTYITGPLAALKLGQIISYDCTLGDAAKKVYMALSGHVNAKGTCFPSVTKMAEKLGVSRQAVTKQITVLEAHNYINRKSRFSVNSGGRLANLYTINQDLANDFIDELDVFSKKNISTLLVYLSMHLKYTLQPSEVAGGITSTSFNERKPQGLHEDATSDSCSKISNKTNQNKHINRQNKGFNKITEVEKWINSKKREDQLGISALDRRKIKNLDRKLRVYLTAYQMTDLDIAIRKEIREKKLKPDEAVKYTIRRMEEVLESQLS